MKPVRVSQREKGLDDVGEAETWLFKCHAMWKQPQQKTELKTKQKINRNNLKRNMNLFTFFNFVFEVVSNLKSCCKKYLQLSLLHSWAIFSVAIYFILSSFLCINMFAKAHTILICRFCSCELLFWCFGPPNQ
jgi:hypothetical protein